MHSPQVSIITPCYKASSTLAKTVESILAQTFSDWELILVDDCSPDDTCEKAETWCATDPRIHLIRQKENGGAAVARNTGIGQARGRYIAFLDADDTWLPRKLERQLKLMQENNWPLSYTGYTRINGAGQQINAVGVPCNAADLMTASLDPTMLRELDQAAAQVIYGFTFLWNLFVLVFV